MIGDLSDLRETIYAVRLLREQTMGAPVRPDVARALRSEILRANAVAPVGVPLLRVAVAEGLGGGGRVDAAMLARLAAAAGSDRPRVGPGAAFQGRGAPPAARIPALVEELVETLSSPVAMETWPPVARAFVAHFLVRLVQPFDAPPAALGAAVEAAILAADGLPADRFLLPEPDTGADAASARPDPDAFVRDRIHRLVERVADTHDRLRDAAARAALLSWCDERGSRLSARPRRLVRWLAEDAARSADFREYVRLHSGRRAPSLRSLQRDWKALRESGLLSESEGRLRAAAEPLAWGNRAAR